MCDKKKPQMQMHEPIKLASFMHKHTTYEYTT
jgi:hypothetical protein